MHEFRRPALLKGRQSAGENSSDYIHIDNYEKFRKKRFIRKSTPNHHGQQNGRSRQQNGQSRTNTGHRSGPPGRSDNHQLRGNQQNYIRKYER